MPKERAPKGDERQIERGPSAASLTGMHRDPKNPKDRPQDHPSKGKDGTLLKFSALLIVAAVTLCAAGWLVVRPGAIGSVRETFSSVEALRDFVAGFGAWAPVVFFVAQVAQVVLAPVPGGVAVVVGALLFGVWGGLALSVAGAVVGSGVLFVVVRRWGRPLAMRLVGEGNLQRYVGVLDEKGTVLFAILLVPFMPDDVVCALAGLSKVSLRRFVVLVAVGRTPTWLATALITADLTTRSTAIWVSAGLVIAALTVVALLYRKRLEGRLLGLAGKTRKR